MREKKCIAGQCFESSRFEEIEKGISEINKDLKGSSSRPGVFEKLRQLEKLVKISITVSILAGGANQVDWQSLLKILI